MRAHPIRCWRRRPDHEFACAPTLLLLAMGWLLSTLTLAAAPPQTTNDAAYAASAALAVFESLESDDPPPQRDATNIGRVSPPEIALPAAANAATSPPTPASQDPTTPAAAGETAAGPASGNPLDDKHKLGVGDKLSFRLVEDEDGAKALMITDSGEIEVPYIGRFTAAGKTCRELAEALEMELEKEYYYQATVIVAVDLKARSRGRVYLIGPVRVPGPQDIPNDEPLTVSKAILRAGGFTDIADRKNVRITRKGASNAADTTLIVNVADILEKGRAESDEVLQPGDLIYVPERLIRF